MHVVVLTVSLIFNIWIHSTMMIIRWYVASIKPWTTVNVILKLCLFHHWNSSFTANWIWQSKHCWRILLDRMNTLWCHIWFWYNKCLEHDVAWTEHWNLFFKRYYQCECPYITVFCHSISYWLTDVNDQN